MEKTKLLCGSFLIFIFCAPARNASAQAATEYGLISGSSATSVSGVGTSLNHKLSAPRTVNTSSHLSTTVVVHRSQASGSKVANTSNAQRSAVTTTNRSRQQASVAGSSAGSRGVPQGGFTVVGGESASHPTVARTVGTSQSGFTVVGSEPQ